MRARYYTFNLPSGIKLLTIEEARLMSDPLVKERLNEIIGNLSNRKRVKDGFEPGIQLNTGKYAGGKLEYQKQLKEMGLVEIGYDYIPTESTPDYNPCATESFVQSCLEEGVDLTGNEIEAIKTGEYFKD